MKLHETASISCFDLPRITYCAVSHKNNKVTGEERLLADKSERFRSITQDKDGALYTVTDGGELYWIGKK